MGKFAHRGFTLLEIIIVLSIAAVLIALCAPFVSGLLRENEMRTPVRELQDLAKIMRSRAMTENTAYEIIFNREGFFGRKHQLYRDEEDQSLDSAASPTVSGTDEPLQGAKQPPVTDGTAAVEAPSELIAEFKLPEGMACQLRFWGSNNWIEPGSDFGTSQWVFQASGLCNPIRAQFRKGDSWIDVAFNPLTADIQEERYFFGN